MRDFFHPRARSIAVTAGAAASIVLLAVTRAAADEAAAQPESNKPDTTNVCKTSYEQAQELMKPGVPSSSSSSANANTSTLLPAREMLRTCMRAGCKDWMVADCSKWLGEVEARIPTAVFSARNTAGRDLTDVSVSRPSGGEPMITRLDGRVVELEPGEQTFIFTAPDGTQREKRVLVREGEKAQSISALFDASPEELAASGRSQQGGSNLGGGGDRQASSRQASTLTYVGYGLAGVGVVGLALGAIFGATAIAKKDEARCDAKNECDAEPLSDARSAATISTVGFVGGAALLAGGIALIVLSPPTSSSPSSPSATSSRKSNIIEARLTPFGVGLGGRW